MPLVATNDRDGSDSAGAASSSVNDSRSGHAASLQQRYGAGATLDDRVGFLTDLLLEHETVRQWKHTLKTELARPEHALEQLQPLSSTAPASASLHRLADKMGLVAALKRLVVDLHCQTTQAVQTAARQQASEEEASLIPDAAGDGRGCTLDVVVTARESWERITREELLRFATEQSKPLVSRLLNPVRNAALASVPGAASTNEDDAPSLPADPDPVRSYKPPASTRFLYDGRDLLHTLQSIKPANRSADALARAADAWTSIQLSFHCPSALELRRMFPELSPGAGQIGLDDLFPTERHAFLAEKTRVGDRVCAHASVAMARQYAKTGCPASLRPQIWRQALGLPAVDAAARQYFQRLQDHVTQWTYLTDDMYLLDLQRAIDSSDYFVFQDALDSVVLAFTRDTFVRDHALQVNGAVPLPPTAGTRGGEDVSKALVPPNGVLPFSGLVMYVAPLTYLYSDDVELYYVFREMYVRYWCRLNAIRSERATILPLCQLFEQLVLRSSPGAVLHLLNVGLQPLDIAFPWIQRAFAGVLEIRQVLLLWDRVVGFDTLELLAVCAAALFHFRAPELERVASMDDVDALFAELLEIHVVPLLQEYIFLLA